MKEKYEVHHGVRVKDSAIISAVELSDRYITNRFLPDKAVDLVDEAASRLKIELDSMQTEIDELVVATRGSHPASPIRKERPEKRAERLT